MLEGTTYNFYVDSNGGITASQNNGTGVTWDSALWEFKVIGENCNIQLNPGSGVASVDQVEFDMHYKNLPLTVTPTPPKCVTLFDPDTSGNQRHWKFRIKFTDGQGNTRWIDPKIYNDGSTGDPPTVA